MRQQNSPVIVIPLITSEMHCLLARKDGQQLLEDFFLRVAETLATCFAVGKNPKALSLAEAAGLQTMEVALLPEETPLSIPRYGAAAIDSIRRAGKLSSETPVLIVHCEAVLTSTEELAAALDAATSMKKGQLGLSVTNPEHHPCHLYLYQQVLDAGVITLLEPPTGNAHTSKVAIITKPFYFDWEVWGADLPAGQWTDYTRILTGTGGRVPLGRQEPCCGMLFKETPTQARFGLPHQSPLTQEAIGVCIPDSGIGPVLIEKEGDLIFRFPEMPASECTLTLRLHDATGAPISQPETIYAKSESAIRLPGTIDLTKASQVAYTLCERNGNPYHLRTPYPQSKGRWKFSHDNAQMINTDTGQAITGRQQFPAVWQTTGTLAAGRAETLEAIASAPEGFDMIPLHVEKDKGGLHVSDLYALLKAVSLRERAK